MPATEGDFQLPARQLTPSACERIDAPTCWRLLLPFLLSAASSKATIWSIALIPDSAVAVLGPAKRASPAQENSAMSSNHAEALRLAIENLIDAKLHDAMAKPGGLDRLVAHRRTGVASYDIRMAERKLQESLAELMPEHEHAFS